MTYWTIHFLRSIEAQEQLQLPMPQVFHGHPLNGGARRTQPVKIQYEIVIFQNWRGSWAGYPTYLERKRNCQSETRGGDRGSIRSRSALESHSTCHTILSTLWATLHGGNTLNTNLTHCLHLQCMGSTLAPNSNGENHLERVCLLVSGCNTCSELQKKLESVKSRGPGTCSMLHRLWVCNFLAPFFSQQ